MSDSDTIAPVTLENVEDWKAQLENLQAAMCKLPPVAMVGVCV